MHTPRKVLKSLWWRIPRLFGGGSQDYMVLKVILVFSFGPRPKLNKIDFQNRKWNYPNRKWIYFTHFQVSDQETCFTKCFSFDPRSYFQASDQITSFTKKFSFDQRSSNSIFKTGNGIIQTENGIISPTSQPFLDPPSPLPQYFLDTTFKLLITSLTFSQDFWYTSMTYS